MWYCNSLQVHGNIRWFFNIVIHIRFNYNMNIIIFPSQVGIVVSNNDMFSKNVTKHFTMLEYIMNMGKGCGFPPLGGRGYSSPP